jgi:ligand-binding SRPBCC domain-containing protein
LDGYRYTSAVKTVAEDQVSLQWKMFGSIEMLSVKNIEFLYEAMFGGAVLPLYLVERAN